MTVKYLIVGGAAGGATAAARLRRLDEQGSIVMLEKGPYISYASCGLPYYLSGVIATPDKLLVQTPADFARRFNLEVRTGHEAVGLDTVRKVVTVKTKDGRTYEESYDKLLLSPGSSGVRPKWPGVDLPGVFTLRSVDDALKIREYIEQRGIASAVVAGGGFIGLEAAENLRVRGLAVTLVEFAPQVMPPADPLVACALHRELLNHDVALRLNTGVKAIAQAGEDLLVTLTDGSVVGCGLLIVATGGAPNLELARLGGLKIGRRGIVVSSNLETSVPGVYAVGDAIELINPLTRLPGGVPLAGPANRQARLAADHMCNMRWDYEGGVGTSIVKVFALKAAMTGLSERQLKEAGLKHFVSTVTVSPSHASYYPGAMPLITKLNFDRESGRLYGVQCVGNDGVDKRVDEAALIIKHGGTIHDLTALEQCYAPPFSSAKDPLAIAGYVAQNVRSALMEPLDCRDLDSFIGSGAVLIDVRTKEEFAAGAIAGAVNIPVDDLRERLGEVPKGRKIVVYCAVGQRGYVATRILKGHGFSEVYNLSGGYKIYRLYRDYLQPPLIEPRGGVSGQQQRIQRKDLTAESGQVLTVDACSLQCPGPIMKLKEAVDRLKEGQSVLIKATDPSFATDAQAWCKSTGQEFMGVQEQNGVVTVQVRKCAAIQDAAALTPIAQAQTIIVFSDDLDKVLAAFVLANGALAAGRKVTMFFTFWGLNVLKKEQGSGRSNGGMMRLFQALLPRGADKLRLSRLSFGGLGGSMMKQLMRQKGVPSLSELMAQARAGGAEFIACQMSMELMGIKREELIDGVSIGGVATYMERSGHAGSNLFI